MFSVICPTMWYGKELSKLLPMLDDCPDVGEIIIINNHKRITPDWFKTDWKKVITLTPPENIYVSPAFNLGVENANNSQIALLQDDVIFHTSIFKKMLEFVTPEQGCYAFTGGMHATTDIFSADFVLPPSPEKLEFFNCVLPGGHDAGVDNWLSVLMFLHKDNYKPIPDWLKIHFGEHYINYYHFKIGKPPKLITNFPCYSTSPNQTTSKIAEPEVNKAGNCTDIRRELEI